MFLKKTFKSLLAFVLVFLAVASLAPKARAGFSPQNCGNISVESIEFKDTYAQANGSIKVRVNNLTPGEDYFLTMLEGTGGLYWSTSDQIYQMGQPLEFELPIPGITSNADSFTFPVHLKKDTLGVSGFNPTVCELGTVTVTRALNLNCEFRVTQKRDLGTAATPNIKSCDILKDANTCVERGSPLVIDVVVKDPSDPNRVLDLDLDAEIRQGFCLGSCWKQASAKNGKSTFEFNVSDYPAGTAKYEIRISQDTWGSNYITCPPVSYNLTEGLCQNTANQRVCGTDSGGYTNPGSTSADPYRLCSQIPSATARAQCELCAGGEFGRDGVWTAVGCIKRDPVSMIKTFMRIGLGMAGGVALLTTLAAAFTLSTSQGDPSKANQAKEMITNSVIGILFIIFSVVILQFIGVTIFNIPGFGTVK